MTPVDSSPVPLGRLGGNFYFLATDGTVGGTLALESEPVEPRL
jgi:hypothetical protein